jgi:pimeloyl-ACP methyl ester carboxylesterase
MLCGRCGTYEVLTLLARYQRTAAPRRPVVAAARGGGGAQQQQGTRGVATVAVSERYLSKAPDGGDGGDPVVVLHGLLGNKLNWRSLFRTGALAEVSERRDILALDARNHGDSPHTDESAP